MSKRYPTLLIQDMIQAVEDLNQSVKDIGFNEFIHNREKINACCFAVQVLGEAASKVSDEIQLKATEIPWKQIRAYRNRIVHEYFEINYDMLWEIATIHAPLLLVPLTKILSSLER